MAFNTQGAFYGVIVYMRGYLNDINHANLFVSNVWFIQYVLLDVDVDFRMTHEPLSKDWMARETQSDRFKMCPLKSGAIL